MVIRGLPDDWDVERDLVRLQRELERRSRRGPRRSGERRARLFPSLIISTHEDMLLVRAEVPGMMLEDFDVTVSGDTLTLKGTRVTGQDLEGGWYHKRERESGGFSRAVRLPADVDGGRAEASYVAGVLTITLPLREPAKPRQISVRVKEGGEERGENG